jgi:hypothetical protein
VIDANIIGPLVQLLQNAEFDIKKEAAWAISNATSGGTHEQLKYVEMFIFAMFPRNFVSFITFWFRDVNFFLLWLIGTW